MTDTHTLTHIHTHFCHCYLKASKISKCERGRVAVILGIVRGVLISLSKAVEPVGGNTSHVVVNAEHCC